MYPKSTSWKMDDIRVELSEQLGGKIDNMESKLEEMLASELKCS